VIERRGVDHDGEPLLLADRRDAARDVAGGPLGGGDLGHDRLLAAHGGGERLEVELPVDGNYPHRERSAACGTALYGGDQRLEHPLWRQAERVTGLKPVRPGARVVRVLMKGERDLCPLKRDRRHGASSSHEWPP
jgi:hypothetical protein